MSSFISTVKAFFTRGLPQKSATSALDGALSEISTIGRNAGQSVRSSIATSPADIQPSSSSSQTHNTGLFALLNKSNKELQETARASDLASLAQSLYSGTSPGVPRDLNRASKLWVLAAGKGDLNSLLQVGLSSIEGLGIIPKDWARAHGILLQLVEKANHPWAHFALATLLLRRRLLAEENEAAVLNEENSSRRSSSSSSSAVDVSRLQNRTHPDCIRGLMSLTSAAESGIVPPSLLNLANCLAYGIGTYNGEPDRVTAGKWLVLAAQRGDPMACVLVAQAIRSSISKTNTKEEINKTATLFDVDSHLQSEKVESASSREDVWWRRAAVSGHSAAMHNIAVRYLNSDKKEERDAPTALIWLERAAELGLLRSRLNAGLLLERGAEGVKIDLDAAKRHFEQAKDQLESAMQSKSSPTVMAWHEKAHKLTLQRLSIIEHKMGILNGHSAENAMGNNDDDENFFDVRIDFDTKEDRDEAFVKLVEGSNPQGVTGGDVHALLQSYSSQSSDDAHRTVKVANAPGKNLK
jgi:TPR repeat protein